MKRQLFLLTGFCLLALAISYAQQSYVQQGNDCFDKGDYECAKLKYMAQKVDGSPTGMDAKIELCDKCIQILTIADYLFSQKDYANAKSKYDELLSLNPKDPRAKKQSDICTAEISRSNATPETTPSVPVSTNLFVNYTETINNLNIEMIAVQGGTFTMGCTSEQGRDCYDYEKPAHQVTVSSFYIGKYEVTQGQWKAVMGDNPSRFPKGDNYPVEWVNWNDVQEFISKLNAITGKNYRLPTEAEWEYAARGGNKSQGYKYSGSNNLSNVAWYDKNSREGTHTVGTKSANELGIFDMSGNVLEWCSDWFSYYSASSQQNPIGKSTGTSRVSRGGNISHRARLMRVSMRFFSKPDSRYTNLGFRLAYSSN